MEILNNYWYTKNYLTPNQCQSIIELGNSIIEDNKSKGISTKAVTAGNEEKDDDDRISKGEFTNSELIEKNIDIKKTYIRDSEVAWLSEKWLYDLIIKEVHNSNKNAGWNYDIDYFEQIQFTKYEAPGGFYGWHRDGSSDWHAIYKRYIPGITLSPFKKDGSLRQGLTRDSNMVGKIRKLSVTINLSEASDYDGGLLKFDFGSHATGNQFHTCEEITPRGSMIVFPSFTPHCVTPVTRGTRYSLVMWCLGRPFR